MSKYEERHGGVDTTKEIIHTEVSYVRRLTPYTLPASGEGVGAIHLEVLEPEEIKEGALPERKLTPMQMAKGLAKATMQAISDGRVDQEVREERLATCSACPFFNKDAKTCNKCGCFMEIKSWIGGNPDSLCPDKRWKR